MPSIDWQFATVTVIALIAFGVLVRRLAPARKSPGAAVADPGCGHCASNPQNRSAPPPRTTTTPVVSLRDLRETARK